jgi:hypothetical protein
VRDHPPPAPVRDLFEMLKSHRDVESVENRRLQDSSAGENAPESGATIGEGRQHGVLVSTNRVEVLSDQPFNVRPGFRDGAENLTTAGFRFDIANPHLELTFAGLAGLMKVESTVTVIAAPAAAGLIAARSVSAAPTFRVWRRNVSGSGPASTGNVCFSRAAPTL